MPLKSIIKHYHSNPIGMVNELKEVQALYNAASKGKLLNGKKVTIDDVLKKCFASNHFHCLHLTPIQRTKLVTTVVSNLKKHHILLSKAKDFETLYSEVQKVIGNINQVGPLVLYDTTKMIGHVLKIAPKNYVYTQCGSKVGAKILLGEKRMGKRIPTKVLHSLFPGEESIYIEDMLCIYKRYFVKGGMKKGTFPFPSKTSPICTSSKPRIRKCTKKTSTPIYNGSSFHKH